MPHRGAVAQTIVPALLVLLCAHCEARGALALRAVRQEAGKYEKLELLIDVDRDYDSPFDPCAVQIDVLLTSPGGRSLRLPAFFAQDYERRDFERRGKTTAWYYPTGAGSWQARFAPTEVGTYTARASWKDANGQTFSPPVQFKCTDSPRPGFLRPHAEDPRFLQFSEGEPFFVIGQNLAFVGEGQYVNVPKAEAIFARLAENGANFVRIWTCCKDWALAIEAEKSVWTRSWTRQSPVVALPETGGEADARKCVKLAGEDGVSLTASPSHPVGLRPQTRYAITGRFKTDRCQGLRLQIGGDQWDLPAGDDGWQTFRKEFVTGPGDYWLGRVAFRLVGAGAAWLDALSLKEVAGGAELFWEADVNRPPRGYYNPLDCFMLDQIVAAAEQNGIYLMLCLITRDLYMSSLSDIDSAEYREATEDAKKLMRYAVARWGYSASVAAWEYFNEMDPGKPTNPFYADLGAYLEEIDVYRHLRTTSTWSPSARDCRHPQLDVAQEHHYMRPSRDDFKDEVTSIVEQTRFLREHAPGKPALIGEFGLADDKWGLSDYMKQDSEGVHFHNCLWASAFAGSSGTAMFWWWDQLDRQDAYRHYRPLATFLEDVSFVGLEPAHVTASDERIRVLGYQGNDRAYLWLSNKEATWLNLVVEDRKPGAIAGATIRIPGLRPGRYRIHWCDTRAAKTTETQEHIADRKGLNIPTPAFHQDLACKIERL
ncbi:MAG: DUF5060 domain-containing protein [Sedimentisphaerales bacterium]|nr:DUF5060 domain-containing protein [Sedimentisphaerales bacterium]